MKQLDLLRKLQELASRLDVAFWAHSCGTSPTIDLSGYMTTPAGRVAGVSHELRALALDVAVELATETDGKVLR